MGWNYILKRNFVHNLDIISATIWEESIKIKTNTTVLMCVMSVEFCCHSNKLLHSSLPCVEHALTIFELQPKFFSFSTHFCNGCLHTNRQDTQGSRGSSFEGCVPCWCCGTANVEEQTTPGTVRGPGEERPLTEHVLWECLTVGMCLHSRPDSCAFSLHRQFRFSKQTSASV